MQSWEIHTVAGALYRIGIDSNGRWQVSGDCAGTPPGAVWEIRPPTPWPPRIGEPLELRAPLLPAVEDAPRIPGGLLVTDDVAEVRTVSGDAPVRVPLGRFVATPAAMALAEKLDIDILHLLERHLHGDWGAVAADGRQVNLQTLAEWHGTVLSCYGQGDARLWIATSIGHDGVATSLMLPTEW